jgi:hypothetical protein
MLLKRLEGLKSSATEGVLAGELLAVAHASTSQAAGKDSTRRQRLLVSNMQNPLAQLLVSNMHAATVSSATISATAACGLASYL